MPKVTFLNYGESPSGFAPVDPANRQRDALYHCKETFSRRLVGWGDRRQALEVSKRGTVKFLHKDSTPKTPEFATHKAKTLHVFEKAMGFTPAAKVSVVTNGHKTYLFYEVSASWAKSHPVAHILALLVRNHYPTEGWPMEWPEIVAWLKARRKITGAEAAVYEIIAAKGAVRREIPEVNGITEYARARKQILEARLAQVMFPNGQAGF